MSGLAVFPFEQICIPVWEFLGDRGCSDKGIISERFLYRQIERRREKEAKLLMYE